jgi:hypothetical protein
MADAPGATDEQDPDQPTTLLPSASSSGCRSTGSVWWPSSRASISSSRSGSRSWSRIRTSSTRRSASSSCRGCHHRRLVQPTIGALSDYTITRWGKRKPYIVIGATLDVVFLIGLATSQTFIALVVFVVLLQFSSNFAQGPFQGYVPDLVPAPQVGLASGMVGLFTILGVVTGSALASLGVAMNNFTLPTIALGVIEFITMLSLFFRLDEGRKAKDRGASWPTIAKEAWGTDILRERSPVPCRFAPSSGGSAFLITLAVPYLERALDTDKEERGSWIFITTLVAAAAPPSPPSRRALARVGRKRVIYGLRGRGAGDDRGTGRLRRSSSSGPSSSASRKLLAVDWR